MSGDQDYDYQDDYYLSNVNLLVACHHGGEYSWSKETEIPGCNTHENKIVYSYGDGNKYNHPSHVAEYLESGWRVEHHTPIDGNYEIDLKLADNTAQSEVLKARGLMEPVIEV